MRYDRGAKGSSECSTYGGESLCGASGSSVAMKDLSCTGDELSVKECSWAAPTSDCSSHAQDAVVFCAAGEPGPKEGTLRLIGTDGAPATTGRLEVLLDSRWGAVCSEGFSSASATTACKNMGFSASANSVQASCASVDANFCGQAPPHMSQLACTGNEQSVLECAFERGDEVFCGANEAVVLGCAGDGDTQGRANNAPPAHLSA
jgi:hypothetical protein